MTKLCPRGKAAAKRKFKVYPSAYANAYASKICAGKIKDPSGVKRKDFRGSKAEGGLMEATSRLKRQGLKKGGGADTGKKGEGMSKLLTAFTRSFGRSRSPKRTEKMGGGMMRPMYKKGGGADMGKTTSRGMLKPSPGDKPIHRFGGSERSDMRKKNKSKAYKGGNRSRPKILASGGRINMKSGGGVCLRGMNREAIGKNS